MEKQTYFGLKPPAISLREARKLLGADFKGLSDSEVTSFVGHVSQLTDIVIAHIDDSKIQSSIELMSPEAHTHE